MATVQTNDLRVQNAKNLISSLINQPAYTFIGRPTPWPNETVPPTPDNSIEEYYEVMDQMMSLKRIYSTDCYHMIPRINWTSGVVYDTYRHDYRNSNPANSGATDLYNCVFVVKNSDNNVYVCLDNDNNSGSFVEPKAKNNEPFLTSDGYQWMRVYTLTQTDIQEYSSANYIPVRDFNSTNRGDGEINTVIIDNPGQGYTNNPAGAQNNIVDYYVPLSGDGTSAVAKVYIESGRVSSVEIVRRGAGYTYAELNFKKENCYATLANLDRKKNALDPLGNDTARFTVIISPPGGWGYDLPKQLGGYRVGIFSDLKYNLTDFTVDSTFRQVGVLQYPEAVTYSDTLSAVDAFKCIMLNGTALVAGQTIKQVQDDGSIAYGQVVGFDADNNIVRYIQTPEIHKDVDGNLVRFTVEPLITVVDELTICRVDNVAVIESDLTFENGFATPEFTKNTGCLTYLTNIKPIRRSETQSERISFVITY